VSRCTLSAASALVIPASCCASLSRAVCASRNCVDKPLTDSRSSAVRPRSSERISLRSASCLVARVSAVSCRFNVTPRKACASTNTSSTKMMTINSVDSAST
jgi:hypothetical protein